MELGFLQRLRASELWPRISVVFGTSAGALCGCMAVLDRLDDLEAFLLALRQEDAFRANRLWQLPLLGTHDYVLPRTVRARLGDPVALAREVQAAEAELVAVVTDLTVEDAADSPRLFERAYSSREATPQVLAQAVLASAAISALVIPQPVGDRVATDGGWVRNFPLGYAYEREDVNLIVGFRYEPRYPLITSGVLADIARRLRRYTLVPAARMLQQELDRALERERRGLPAHVVDTFSRLSRVSIIRSTAVEELVALWREQSISGVASLRDDVLGAIDEATLAPAARRALRARVEDAFRRAEFPFRHDRAVPRITVSASAGEHHLEPGFRTPRPWTEEVKRALIERGRVLTGDALAAAGVTS